MDGNRRTTHVSFRIYTLSFQEYLEFKKQYTQVKDIHTELADYIRLGGFPEMCIRDSCISRRLFGFPDDFA